jgi:hypothetical protein
MQARSALGNPNLSTAGNVDVELLTEIDCNNWTWHQTKQAEGGAGTASGRVSGGLEKEFEALMRATQLPEKMSPSIAARVELRALSRCQLILALTDF